MCVEHQEHREEGYALRTCCTDCGLQIFPVDFLTSNIQKATKRRWGRWGLAPALGTNGHVYRVPRGPDRTPIKNTDTLLFQTTAVAHCSRGDNSNLARTSDGCFVCVNECVRVSVCARVYVYTPLFLCVIHLQWGFFSSYLFDLMEPYLHIVDFASPNSRGSVGARSEGAVFIKPH